MEADFIILQDIFRFELRGIHNRGKVKGEFVSTGIMPKFVQKLKEKGMNIPIELL